MADVVVHVGRDRANEVGWFPGEVMVNPGDTLCWGSFQGDVVVSFVPNSPFKSGNQAVKARKGSLSPSETIRDVEGEMQFTCEVALGGGPAVKLSYGVIIRRN